MYQVFIGKGFRNISSFIPFNLTNVTNAPLNATNTTIKYRSFDLLQVTPAPSDISNGLMKSFIEEAVDKEGKIVPNAVGGVSKIFKVLKQVTGLNKVLTAVTDFEVRYKNAEDAYGSTSKAIAVAAGGTLYNVGADAAVGAIVRTLISASAATPLTVLVTTATISYFVTETESYKEFVEKYIPPVIGNLYDVLTPETIAANPIYLTKLRSQADINEAAIRNAIQEQKMPNTTPEITNEVISVSISKTNNNQEYNKISTHSLDDKNTFSDLVDRLSKNEGSAISAIDTSNYKTLSVDCLPPPVSPATPAPTPAPGYYILKIVCPSSTTAISINYDYLKKPIIYTNSIGSYIIGSSNNLVIYGGNGDDRIYVYSNSIVNAGDGNNIVSARHNSYIISGSGDDNICTDSNSVVIAGGGNNNVNCSAHPYSLGYNNMEVTGGDGNDRIYVGANSVVNAGGGNNIVSVVSNGTVITGSGDDSISVGDNSIVNAGEGKNTVYIGSYNTITTGSKDDSIFVNGNYNVVYAGDGNNNITSSMTYYYAKNMMIVVGKGDDRISVSSNSIVNAGEGNNIVSVGSNGTVVTGSGNDSISVGDNSIVNAGLGNNIVSVGRNCTVVTGSGDDTIKSYFFYNNIIVNAGEGNNIISVGSNSTIITGSGDDRIGENGVIQTNNTIITGNGNNIVFNFINSIIKTGNGNDCIGMRQGVNVITGGGYDVIVAEDCPGRMLNKITISPEISQLIIYTPSNPACTILDFSLYANRNLEIKVSYSESVFNLHEQCRRNWDSYSSIETGSHFTLNIAQSQVKVYTRTKLSLEEIKSISILPNSINYVLETTTVPQTTLVLKTPEPLTTIAPKTAVPQTTLVLKTPEPLTTIAPKTAVPQTTVASENPKPSSDPVIMVSGENPRPVVGTSDSENFVVDRSVKQATISGGAGIDRFKFVPSANSKVTITDFELYEQIDLTSFRAIRSFSDLHITKGSAIINLPEDQTITIKNKNPEDLSEYNFIVNQQDIGSDATEAASELIGIVTGLVLTFFCI